MYQVTESTKQYEELADALAEAIRVVFRPNVTESTVYTVTRRDGKPLYTDLYTVTSTPTRRLSIVNLF